MKILLVNYASHKKLSFLVKSVIKLTFYFNKNVAKLQILYKFL